MRALVLQNRWEILRELDEDVDEAEEEVKFPTSSSEEEDKANQEEEEKIDLFNQMPDEVKYRIFSPLVLRNRWEILTKLDRDEEEKEKEEVKFAASGSGEEVKATKEEEEDKENNQVEEDKIGNWIQVLTRRSRRRYLLNQMREEEKEVKWENNWDEEELVKIGNWIYVRRRRRIYLFNQMPEEQMGSWIYVKRRRIDLFHQMFPHIVKSLIFSKKKFASSGREEEKMGKLIKVRRKRIDLFNQMLPDDVKSIIFSKLGALEILMRVQYVCTSWRNLSKDPALFRVIDARDVDSFSGSDCIDCYRSRCNQENTSWVRDCQHYTRWKHQWIRPAVDRSCGQLTELRIGGCLTDDLLHYIVDNNSNSLKCLVLKRRCQVSSHGLIEAVSKVPLLEEFEWTYYWCFSVEAIAEIGRSCLNLHHFALNFDYARSDSDWACDRLYDGAYDVHALAIAANMPKLRCLTLLGNLLTNEGLQVILDGCPCLEYLDIRGCGRELKEQFEQRLKHLTPLDYPLFDFDDRGETQWSYLPFGDPLGDLHDYDEETNSCYSSSTEEDYYDEDILKFLPPKAVTFYI